MAFLSTSSLPTPENFLNGPDLKSVTDGVGAKPAAAAG